MRLIDDMVQKSDDWHNYRKARIGASDFNFFCRHKGLYDPYYKVNKNDTLDNHFYNKINKVSFTNPFIEIGIELEPQLLNEYNKLTGGCYTPIVGEFDTDSSIFASYDGYDLFANNILEIKTTGKSLDFEKRLIESYLFQVIHQMRVSNKDSCVLLINYYNYGVTKHYTIFQKVFTYEVYFLSKRVTGTMLEDKRWLELCNEYLGLLKEATNELQR